jgi:hypothetical protein
MSERDTIYNREGDLYAAAPSRGARSTGKLREFTS